MRVGVPREVKNREYRVALTPAGVTELVPGTRVVNSMVERLRVAVSLRDRDDRRNVAALGSHLAMSTGDAERIYRRSREVGYPTAMTEYEAQQYSEAHDHAAKAMSKSTGTQRERADTRLARLSEQEGVVSQPGWRTSRA